MKLSDWLAREGVSDRNFAETIGVSRQSVHRYKSGERLPRPNTLARINSETGGEVTVNDFWEAPQLEPAERVHAAE